MGHDGHYLGRDPVGAKENRAALQHSLQESPLTRELIKSLELINKKEFSKLITEDDTNKSE
jgi:hypothetical protein